jgi:hypothetical protein
MSHTPEIRQRAAVAVQDYFHRNWVDARASERSPQFLDGLVCAVIAALREPSEAMIQRGAYAAIEQWGREPDVRGCWSAMIDVALMDGP